MNASLKDLIAKLLNHTDTVEFTIDDNSKMDDKNIFSEEKIVMRASSISPPAPRQYKELIQIEPKINSYYWNAYYKQEKFYLQAKFMESFEEDYVCQNGFSCYYPTYMDMNISQQRGYFSWRTKLRKGIIEQTQISFVFLYVYEIIHQVGVESPDDGLDKLIYMYEKYGGMDSAIKKHISEWIRDYIIYYNLTTQTALNAMIKHSQISTTLERISTLYDDSKLVGLLAEYSGYKIEKSKFFKDYSADYLDSFAMVYNGVKTFYNENRKSSITEKMFGMNQTVPWVPFKKAVFYPHISFNPNTQVVVNSFEKYYIDENKNWYRSFYSSSHVDKKFIAELFKTTDFIMRNIYNYPTKLTIESSSKTLYGIIEKAVFKYCSENGKYDLFSAKKATKSQKKQLLKEKPNPQPILIEFDATKFEDIRLRAKDIEQKLIINDEDFIMQPSADMPIIDVPPADVTPAAQPFHQQQTGISMFMENLTQNELKVIRFILDRQYSQFSELIKSLNTMPEVFLEQINTKALNFIDDIIIDLSDMLPCIYEDYVTNVRGLFGERR